MLSKQPQDFDPADDTVGVRPSAVTLAARELLASCKPVIRRLRRREPICVVIVPAQSGWSAALERELTRLLDEKPKHGVFLPIVMRETATTRQTADDRAAVLGRLETGLPVVGISHAPDACLPAVMLRASDVVVRLKPLSGTRLRRVITAVTGEDAGRILDDLAGAVTVEDIAACVRPGTRARDCVARLEAARTARSRTREVDVPPLEALAGYGEAKHWGLQLAREISRCRAGRIALADLPRGMLLSGPPGCGKTLFFQALARSCGVPIVATSAATWLSAGDGHLDDVIKAMKSQFDAAAAARPAILFIDEIDAIVDPEASSGNSRSWWMSFRAALLSAVDGAGSAPGIILVGACNHVDLVDRALRRAGRLDRHIAIGLPDRAALVDILRTALAGELADEDLSPLAALAVGSTGAEMARAVRDARACARDAGRALALADLHRAIAPVDDRPPDEVESVALHEAGHAVVATLLGYPVEIVSIVPGSGSAGHALIATPHRLTATALEHQVVIALSGRAADVALGKGPCAGSASDLAHATCLIARAHATYGLAERLTSVSEPVCEQLVLLDAVLRERVEADLDRLWQRALALALGNGEAIKAVAAILSRERVVVGTRVEDIVSLHRLPASPQLSAPDR